MGVQGETSLRWIVIDNPHQGNDNARTVPFHITFVNIAHRLFQDFMPSSILRLWNTTLEFAQF
jgi:hypothetical protein